MVKIEEVDENAPLAASLKSLASETPDEAYEEPELEHPSVSRIVRAGPRVGPDGKPHYLVDDIPDNEKMRLIRESGLLRKYGRDKENGTGSDADPSDLQKLQDQYDSASDVPVWMDAIIYSVGLAAVYGLFEALVSQQYSVDISFTDVVKRMGSAAPALYVIVLTTLSFRKSRAVALLMLAAACASGCYFVHLNLHSPRLGIMRRAPGLVTMWIYLTFLMDVRPAMVNAAIVGLFWLVDPFKQTL